MNKKTKKKFETLSKYPKVNEQFHNLKDQMIKTQSERLFSMHRDLVKAKILLTMAYARLSASSQQNLKEKIKRFCKKT